MLLSLPYCCFYVHSFCLSAKVFAFNSISLTSWHDRHCASYTPGISTDIYFHTAGNSCQPFSIMKQDGEVAFTGQYTAPVVEKNKKWEENGFFILHSVMDFILHSAISSQGLLLMATVLCPLQGHAAELEKRNDTVSIPSHPVSHTYHSVKSRHSSLTEQGRKKERKNSYLTPTAKEASHIYEMFSSD